MALSLAVALVAALVAVPARGAQPAEAVPPPTLPAATYQVASQELLVRMDDGVDLAATLVRPSADGKTALPGPYPVVLSMTPYGRNGLCGCPDPTMFASRGIAAAIVDVRGTGGSGGNLDGNYFSPREARDGYELVEYFGTEPWSSGKVGMAGGSYVGITQYLTAEQQPPHLAAIAPQVAISDLYRDGYTHGGIPNAFFDAQYIGVQGAPGAAGVNSDPSLLEATVAAKAGQSPPGMIAFDYLARPNDDAFYRDRSPIYRADRITVPVLVIGGWNDGLLRGTTEMYTALARRPGVETRLYVDPCTHKGCGGPLAPTTNAPGLYDLSALIFEFLAQYLLGAPAPARPDVQIYVQGANRYETATAWPPTAVNAQQWTLGAGRRSYVTNPAAGFSMAFNKYGTVAASPYIPTDQRLESANGVTVRTPVLTAPLRLTGPIALQLVASSTATDTDWYAKLADVAPDGSESIITEGALRASHRALDPEKSTPLRPYHTHVDPQPIEPNRFYRYDVEIWPTAYQVAVGHRLQLRITSVDVPTHLPGWIRVDRDRPERARVELLSPAVNTVDLGASRLLLPVDRTGE